MPSKAAGWALLALALVQGAAAQAPAAESPITAVPAGGFSQVQGRMAQAVGRLDGRRRSCAAPLAAGRLPPLGESASTCSRACLQPAQHLPHAARLS